MGGTGCLHVFAKSNVQPRAHRDWDCLGIWTLKEKGEIAHYFPKAVSPQKDGWPSVRLLKELTSLLCSGTASPTHSQQDIYSDLQVILALQAEMGSDCLARWSLSFIFALFFFYSVWVKSHKLGLLTD